MILRVVVVMMIVLVVLVVIALLTVAVVMMIVLVIMLVAMLVTVLVAMLTFFDVVMTMFVSVTMVMLTIVAVFVLVFVVFTVFVLVCSAMTVAMTRIRRQSLDVHHNRFRIIVIVMRVAMHRPSRKHLRENSRICRIGERGWPVVAGDALNLDGHVVDAAHARENRFYGAEGFL